jgi:hypothetical protein
MLVTIYMGLVAQVGWGTRRASGRSPAMPVVLLILLVVLVAQFGFWDTFQAVLGAVAMIVILWGLVLAIIVGLAGYVYRQFR